MVVSLALVLKLVLVHGKLHARGPMGLKELTTTKYVVYGDGQVR